MIEIVYTPKDDEKSNDVIKLPKNIKQVGNIKDSRKIYIEDYAINHVNEAHEIDMDKVVGVLMGVTQKSGSERYIFIKGAITVPDVFISESEISISENDWSYIYEISGKYFPNMEVIGWFASLEGVNAAMLRTMKKVHMNHFAGGDKVLFVFDRQENCKNFYVYDNNQLVKQSGYTVFYERNEEMQEYMVDMRNGKKIEVSVSGDSKKEFGSVSEATFRSMVNDDVKQGNTMSRKQSFVNYCANVAMVVLVLFVGMYIMDRREESDAGNVLNESTTAITSVIKVDGEVYPTVSTPAETTAIQSEITVAAPVQTQAETTGSYITINTNETQPAINSKVEEVTTAVSSEPETTATPKTTEAVATYTEHTVKKGENLITICKEYYGDTSMVEKVMALNDIEDMDKIYIGQVIKLP